MCVYADYVCVQVLIVVCVCVRGRDGSHPFFSLNVLVKTIGSLILCYNNSEELSVIRESGERERERGRRRGAEGERERYIIY